MKKKALIVTTVSGFVPQFEMNNVRLLQELGYEVHYASNFKTPHYGPDNHRLEGTGVVCHQVDFVRSPFQILRNIKAYRQLCRLMMEITFSLIHCHTPMGGALGRLAAEKARREKKGGCPEAERQGKEVSQQQKGESGRKPARVIYTAHGFHFYKGAPLLNWLAYYPVERLLARITDILITINEEDYRRAKKFHLRKPKEVGRQLWKVNGTGVDISPLYRNKNTREQVRAQLGVQPSQMLLVSVGELNKNKNHCVVVRALAQTPAESLYLICGEGPEKEKLRKMARKYELGKKVFLAGYQEDIWRFLGAADAFVLPSFREGLSLSLQEAMACGLPAIVSDIRGNRELVDQGKGGWLFHPADINRLHKILESLGSGQVKKERLARMGEYNRKKVSAYSKEAVLEKMREVYTQEGGGRQS